MLNVKLNNDEKKQPICESKKRERETKNDKITK